MNCFLIEDDAASQLIITTQLRKLELDTKVFSQTKPFESILDETPEQLINSILLLDINLPVEDGDAFLTRKQSELKGIDGLKIILLQEEPNFPVEMTDLHSCPKVKLYQFIETLLNEL